MRVVVEEDEIEVEDVAGETELSSELRMRFVEEEGEDKEVKGGQEEVRGAGDAGAGCCKSCSC